MSDSVRNPKPTTALIMVRYDPSTDLKTRLKVACIEDDVTYAEFLTKVLDARDEQRRNMSHPLARPKAAAR